MCVFCSLSALRAHMSDLDMCAMAHLNLRSVYLFAGLVCPVKCDEALPLLGAHRDMRLLCSRVHAPCRLWLSPSAFFILWL